MPSVQKSTECDHDNAEGPSSRLNASTGGEPQANAKQKKVTIVAPEPSKRKKIQQTKPLNLDLPTKVNMGKQSLCQVLAFPIGFLVFCSLFCYALRGLGDPPIDGAPKAPYYERLKSAVEKRIEAKFKKQGGMTAPNCTMYFGASSIPGAGNSIYAGRDYEPGDIIFPTGAFFPVNLGHNNNLWIQQYAFLLKHHHILGNVEGRVFVTSEEVIESTKGMDSLTQGFELKASKPIKAGDELVIPFSQHPKNKLLGISYLFDNIPTSDDFSKAEEIIQDQVKKLLLRRGRGRRPLEDKSIDGTLSEVHQATRRFSSQVAMFLPTKRAELDPWIQKFKTNEPFGLLSLRNKTVSGLKMTARCMSYLRRDPETGKVITTQRIAKGSIVAPAPLLLLPLVESEPENACAADAASGECALLAEDATDSRITIVNKQLQERIKPLCMSHALLPFLLCPLSMASSIEIVASDKDEQEASVEYRWNRFNQHNRKSKTLPVREVSKLYTNQLSMEVIALRDIEAGEQLRMKMSLSADGIPALMMDELVPAGWK